MPLAPSFCHVIESDLSKVYFRDNTGVYDPNNTGGYGSPNNNRNVYALASHIFYNHFDKERETINITSNSIFYDTNYTNSEKSEFTIDYPYSGGNITAYFFWINSTALNTDEGTVYYDTGSSSVFIRQSGNWVAVTDYSTLIGNSSVLQLEKRVILLEKLTLELNKKEIEYSDCLCDVNCKDCDNLLLEKLSFEARLNTSFHHFNSGLYSKSQEIFEQLANNYIST